MASTATGARRRHHGDRMRVGVDDERAAGDRRAVGDLPDAGDEDDLTLARELGAEGDGVAGGAPASGGAVRSSATRVVRRIGAHLERRVEGRVADA